MPPALRKPYRMAVSLTERCNLDCRLCYGDCHRPKRHRELSTDDWLRFLDQIEDLGVVQLYVEGGEPLVRDDFLRLVRASGCRFFTLIRTNATLIDERVACDLRSANVGRVYVDLLGANPETHDFLTGTDGSFHSTMRGIASLREVGIPVIPAVIVNRRNITELQAILDLAVGLGLERVSFLRLYPLGRAKRSWAEFSLSLQEQTRAVRSVRIPRELKLMDSWHPFNRNCCWDSAAINAYGDSIGCPYLREYVRFGNITTSSFMHTWDDETYRLLRSGVVDDACGGCNTTQGTSGGCRASAYAYHRSWTAPDPYCEITSDGVDLRVIPESPVCPSNGPSIR